MMMSRHTAILRTIPFLTAICLLALPAQAKYSGGSGEPNDPYQIATAADLIALGEIPADYDKHFILTADIDLDPNLPGRKVFDKAVIAPDVDQAKDWYQGTTFAGVFDGNGRMLSHLTIRGKSHLGLFGYLQSGAEVKNLGVVDVNIVSSGDCVGGLAGQNEGTVTRCYSSGAAKGGYKVGGLVGRNCVDNDDVGRIIQCYSTGTVNGGSEVGGLVGSNAYGGIANCYSTASVTGSENVGGLVGKIGEGYLRDADIGAVVDCYSTGAVSGSGRVGGLFGSVDWYSDVGRCFWDTQTSGQLTSPEGTGLTTAQMHDPNMFMGAGWDFVGETANGSEDIWKIAEGLGYPRLSWEKYSGGTGEPNDPYQIATAADLIALGETPADYDKHFLLTADIDLDPKLPGRKVFDRAAVAPDTDPVKSGFQGTAFAGVFDGGNHKISHLTITGAWYVGLFGQLTSGAEVTNLGVVDVNITGSGNYVGGLVGDNDGTVTGCYSTGLVRGSACVAGLVGYNFRGIVAQCHSTGVVNGNWCIGGLVGENPWGRIMKSYSASHVTGDENVGGLLGHNGDSDGSWGANGVPGPDVVCCYSTGTVVGASVVGGLVGGNTGAVAGCYSIGRVDGDVHVGGVVGRNSLPANPFPDSVTGCFWDIQTSGQTASATGTGKTTAEMQTAKTFLDAGWDLVGETANGTEDIWWIDEGKDYPRLWWEAAEE